MNSNAWIFAFAAIQALGAILTFFRIDVRFFSQSRPDVPVMPATARGKVVVGLFIGALAFCGIGFYRETAASPQAPSQPIVRQPPFEAQMVLPDGRTIITTTPEELQAAFRLGTIAQFNRLLGGKWVKISGNVSENFGGRSYVLLTQESPRIGLLFGKEWDGQTSQLARGSIVTVRCKVGAAHVDLIDLVECEPL